MTAVHFKNEFPNPASSTVCNNSWSREFFFVVDFKFTVFSRKKQEEIYIYFYLCCSSVVKLAFPRKKFKTYLWNFFMLYLSKFISCSNKHGWKYLENCSRRFCLGHPTYVWLKSGPKLGRILIRMSKCLNQVKVLNQFHFNGKIVIKLQGWL